MYTIYKCFMKRVIILFQNSLLNITVYRVFQNPGFRTRVEADITKEKQRNEELLKRERQLKSQIERMDETVSDAVLNLHDPLENITALESEDIDVENDSDAEKEPLNEDPNEVTTSIELNGMTIVQKGQYSKCPKCKKFIKSTFIIRHIKLHDAKEDKID